MQDSKAASLLAAASLMLAIPSWVWSADGAGAQAGKAKAAQCFACHGPDGMAKVPDAPNLAGQNESYLVKALNDYQSGARKHEVMSMMARSLSEADVAQVATYYSSIPIVVKGP
jgi:cytochrome c553